MIIYFFIHLLWERGGSEGTHFAVELFNRELSGYEDGGDDSKNYSRTYDYLGQSLRPGLKAKQSTLFVLKYLHSVTGGTKLKLDGVAPLITYLPLLTPPVLQ